MGYLAEKKFGPKLFSEKKIFTRKMTNFKKDGIAALSYGVDFSCGISEGEKQIAKSTNRRLRYSSKLINSFITLSLN